MTAEVIKEGEAVAERDDAAEIAAPRLLISLDLSDPLADAIALSLGEGGGDGKKQL